MRYANYLCEIFIAKLDLFEGNLLSQFSGKLPAEWRLKKRYPHISLFHDTTSSSKNAPAFRTSMKTKFTDFAGNFDTGEKKKSNIARTIAQQDLYALAAFIGRRTFIKFHLMNHAF